MKKIMTRLLSLVLLGAFIPSFVLAETWDLENGDIIVNAAPDTTQTVSQGGTTTPDSAPVISTHAPDSTQTGAVKHTVNITAAENATANVTLENVNIDTSTTGEAAITTSGEGSVNIELDGTNTVQSGTYHAGVEKKDNGTLTITDENKDGSLTATGGDRGAGIGGGYKASSSNITISGGEVEAKGGRWAAGIGGGDGGNGSHITIEGGTVTATGKLAAGIGGGSEGNGSHITIENGTVTATGGDNAAGIGGGFAGAGSDITVSGGTVTATGGNGGAGIGSGYNGGSYGATNIKIEGGDLITAKGGENGAGIGGGYNSSANNIEVSKGTVKATGGKNGAGIGGGCYGFGEHITVSGGEVEAIGKENGAGIGGGKDGSGNEINIKDGKVTATGGANAAGIGGGSKDPSDNSSGNGSNITVSGGEVTATGGVNGAGIGGGSNGSGSGVTISGDAQVKAQGGAATNAFMEGAAIGNGGTDTQKGAELDMEQVASGLSVDGIIQTYKPGNNIDTATPQKTTIGKTGEHNWDEGKVTIPATCTTPGEKIYTCTNTAHTSLVTKTEPTPALNHDFKTYIYNNNATCEADGTETAKCERCDEKKTRTKAGSKLGHLFETYVYNNDATQDADGTETAHCAHRGCTVTDTRTAQGTKLPGDIAETAAENQAAPYWVSGPDGQSLPYQAQIKDGVLTVTVQADTASLRGSTGSLGQLEAQGITEIRFITNGAESAFTLSALLTSGTGTFTLTHEGKTVTFTLAEKDISGILK